MKQLLFGGLSALIANGLLAMPSEPPSAGGRPLKARSTARPCRDGPGNFRGFLTKEQRRDVILGKVRPLSGPRGMPAPGRLFKGHRP